MGRKLFLSIVLLSVSIAIADPLPKESPYRKSLMALARTWPPPSDKMPIKPTADTPIEITAIRYSDDPWYVGVRKRMIIDAPLSRVEKVLDNIDDFEIMFSEFDEIRIDKRESNRVLSYWDRPAPMIFAGRIQIKLAYYYDKSKKNRKLYRIELVASDNLYFMDGLIVIEKFGKNKTKYTSYDFSLAKLGIAKIIGVQGLWNRSFEGVVKGDMAIKYRSEHPTWTKDKIEDQRTRMAESLNKKAIQSVDKIF